VRAACLPGAGEEVGAFGGWTSCEVDDVKFWISHPGDSAAEDYSHWHWHPTTTSIPFIIIIIIIIIQLQLFSPRNLITFLLSREQL
jgi:hypothetical protein